MIGALRDGMEQHVTLTKMSAFRARAKMVQRVSSLPNIFMSILTITRATAWQDFMVSTARQTSMSAHRTPARTGQLAKNRLPLGFHMIHTHARAQLATQVKIARTIRTTASEMRSLARVWTRGTRFMASAGIEKATTFAIAPRDGVGKIVIP